MKRSHRSMLLDLICQRGPLSRTELVKETGLSPSYVGSVVRQMEGRGLVVETGFGASRGGRRRVLLQVNPDIAHFIGIDIGSFSQRFLVADCLGNVLKLERCRVQAFRDGRDLAGQINEGISRLRQGDQKIKGIGICVSGLIDPEHGLVSFPRTPGWADVALQKMVEDAQGLRTLVEDSARTAAVAEWLFAGGNQVRDLFYVSLGMGIGAAIFVNGQLCRGKGGFAGEVGHISINENGDLCYCGNRGCLELYASGKAILDAVGSALKQGVTSTLSRLNGSLTYEVVVEAAEQGDKLANRVLSQAGTHLGTALADVVNLLNPDKIVLGGTLAQVAGNLLLDTVVRSLRERAVQQSVRDLTVTVSSLGDDSAARGAAVMAAQRLLQNFKV